MDTDQAIRIPLELVESSAILAIGHDAPKLILAVQFKSGAIWHYATVERFVFNELRDALSIGQYFAANIKGKYPAACMTGECAKCGARHGWIGDVCTDCGCATYVAVAPRPTKSPTTKSSTRGSTNNASDSPLSA